MTTPEERSDQLDDKLDELALVARADVVSRRAVGYMLAGTIAAFLIQFAVLGWIALDNHAILQGRLDEKDRTITRQEYVIDRQAVPAIVYMAGQIEALGATPPRLLLGPQHPPFEPPTEGSTP